MRVNIPLAKAYHLINHGACPLITTRDGVRRDVAPINWTMPVCDDPFLVGMAVEEGIFTDELIRSSREFAINVVGESMAGKILGLGSVSGRKIDKFQAFSLDVVPCAVIQPPRLAAAPAHLECRVVKVHPHRGVNLYIAEVRHAEIEQGCWDGKHLILEKIRTLHHVGGGLFAVTDHAERYEAENPPLN